MKKVIRDEEKEAQLLEKFPASKGAERIRFLTANDGKIEETTNQLEAYLDFRSRHSLDSSSDDVEDDDDEAIWEYAAKKATAFEADNEEEKSSINLPQLAKMYTDKDTKEDLRSLDGLRIIHLLPARLDPELASQSTYSLALALYLDRKVDRDSVEKFMVLIDVRAGMGWANPPATNLIPFIRTTASLLSTNFPERLSKAFLYNVPTVSVVVWETVKPFLDSDTTSKIVLCSGEADRFSPAPKDVLVKHMDEMIATRLEEERFLTFS